MFNFKRVLILALAMATGMAAFTIPALAQGDDIVFLCFRGRTIGVPFYLMNRYIVNGATPGPCSPSQP